MMLLHSTTNMMDTRKVLLLITLVIAQSTASSLLTRLHRSRGIKSGHHHNHIGEHGLTFKQQRPTGTTVVHRGQSIVLECSATGAPAPTIHWLFRGKRITQGVSNKISDDVAEYEISANEGQKTVGHSAVKSRLFLDCLTPAEAGEYACVAETPYKRISSQTHLQVEDMVPEFQEESCLMDRLQGVPARIHMWTESRLEYEGRTVQLYCRTQGNPAPHVTWYHNGQPITRADKQFTVLDDGDLVIANINWAANMGTYKCVSENQHGSDEVSAFLYPTQF